MKMFLVAVLASLVGLGAHADTFWEPTDLRRLVALECVEEEATLPLEEIDCPEDSEASICYVEGQEDDPVEVCDWIDSAEAVGQVQDQWGAMFILKDTVTNWPLAMIVLAEVEKDGVLYRYDYRLELDPDAVDVRQMRAVNEDNTVVFFTEYTLERYKFNLMVDDQIAFFNFWSQEPAPVE
jgi:hypothetical protein